MSDLGGLGTLKDQGLSDVWIVSVMIVSQMHVESDGAERSRVWEE